MYPILFLAVTAVIILLSAAVFCLLSGAGLLIGVCLMSVLSVITGTAMLLRLLGKGIFSALKCFLFLVLMIVPGVNLAALAVLLVLIFKNR